MRRHNTLISTAVAGALFGIVAAAPATAQTSFRDTATLTFSEPVQVPGHTLPAGEYVFSIADKEAARYVAEIWNADQTELITQALIVPTRRQDALGEPAVRFSNTPAGEAPALRAWFVPGESIGQAFVYPEEQAVRIAKETKMLVLASNNGPGTANVAVAEIYHVDEMGAHHDYTKPMTWAEAPLMETAADADMPLMTPDAILDRLEDIVDGALDRSEMEQVTVTRDQLQTILVGLERLRAIMDDGQSRH